MAASFTCPHCGACVPQLVLAEDDLARLRESNGGGSPSLALAELKAATGCSTSQAKAWLTHLEACAHALPLSAADEAVLARVTQAFGDVQRPDPFALDPRHCPECAQHEATLQSAADTYLSRAALGNIGWDPMCLTTQQAVGYFFPTLARFALLPDLLPREWYGEQLLFHLRYEGTDNRFWQWCSPAQCATVAGLLAHLAVARHDMVEGWCHEQNMADALAIWHPAPA